MAPARPPILYGVPDPTAPEDRVVVTKGNLAEFAADRLRLVARMRALEECLGGPP
jgi:hypothetical protein